jgi:hypothetical protein
MAEAREEAGGGEGEGLAHVGPFDQDPQALAQQGTVVGDGLREPGLVLLDVSRGEQAGAPSLHLFIGEQRRAEDDQLRRIEVETHEMSCGSWVAGRGGGPPPRPVRVCNGALPAQQLNLVHQSVAQWGQLSPVSVDELQQV